MTEKPIAPLLEWGISRGFTRSQSYTAGQEGKVPTFTVGKRIFVVVERADRALGLSPDLLQAAE